MKRAGLLVLAVLLLAGCAAGGARTDGDGAAVEAAPNREALPRAMQSVVGLIVERGDNGSDSFGSAVVYGDAGHLVTAHHVVEGAHRIIVLLPDNHTTLARTVAEDPAGDLALLECAAWFTDRMRGAKPAAGEPGIGDEIWSIGNPFGTSRIGGSPSVSRGVVSALRRSYHNEETGRIYLGCLQHDAPTSPGNSGGGVFNARGELLGLNVLVTTMRDGTDDSGVAFALPVDLVWRVAAGMLRGEPASHGWIGEGVLRQARETSGGGMGRLRVMFGPLDDEGPAARAGVLPGDVLAALNGAEIFGLHEALSAIDALPPGGKAKLTINRSGRKLEFEVETGRRRVAP